MRFLPWLVPVVCALMTLTHVILITASLYHTPSSDKRKSVVGASLRLDLTAATTAVALITGAAFHIDGALDAHC